MIIWVNSRHNMSERLSFRQLLQMRRNYVGKSCVLHYEAAPLKIEKACKQYMYDDVGEEYLDCINNIAHVGHCHPHVVDAGQTQMARLSTCQGFITEHLSLYAKQLIETMPDRLNVCYFVNSGSEANDLALRMARTYTKHQDVIVVENAYHGNLGSMIEISPIKLKKLHKQPGADVHIVPVPDIYRGKYKESDENPGDKYVQEVYHAIEKAHNSGRDIAAFVHEPIMSLLGVIIPPKDYLSQVYSYVRQAGGIVIADEIQVGLGRTGEYWSFQTQGVIPDIVTCGKPLGNGHPMAVVVTTKEIAHSVTEFSSGYGGNPVSCVIGIAVLDVIKNEKLLSSAKNVGRTLIEGFKNIQSQHPMMGDVRGIGLVVGIDIVTDKETRKPAKEAAELLCYKIKQEKVLVANAGPEKNVIFLTPPMCFTCANAHRLIEVLDKHLREIECGTCPDKVREITGSNVTVPTTELHIPVGIVTGDILSDSDDEGDAPQWNSKRSRFEDID